MASSSISKMFAVSSLLMIAFFGAAMAKNVHVNWAADVDYAAWAANTTIVQGDRIFFDYPPDPDREAVEVSEERFNSCKYVPDHDDPGITIGDHGIVLSDSGTYYFINDFPGRCESGWKLQFNVLTKEEAAATPPPPPPSPPPPPPGPATPTGPFFPVTPTAGAPFFPRTPPPPSPTLCRLAALVALPPLSSLSLRSPFPSAFSFSLSSCTRVFSSASFLWIEIFSF